MFEELINKVRLKECLFIYKLTECNDPYRLAQILKDHAEDMGHYFDEANEMVKELEDN